MTKNAIIIDWLGFPYGIFTDVYIFQKYCKCDVVWISCHDENRHFNKNMFQEGIIPVLKKYTNLFFIETDFFCFIKDEQKLNHHKFYFLKNLDISPVADYTTYYNKIHLIDYAISRTNSCTNHYEILKQKYGYHYKILYIKFTSNDYYSFYYKRNHFQVENPFKPNKTVTVPYQEYFVEEIPHNLSNDMSSFEYSFLSFGRKNLNIITDFWNTHKEILPKLYIKLYDINHIKNIDQCKKNEKIVIIDKYIDEKEKCELYNKCCFFINMSPEEGYGHNINEARSTGRIILVVNKPPMNELIDNDCGIIINSIEQGVATALRLSQDEIIRKMKLTREKYQNDTQFFIEKVENI